MRQLLSGLLVILLGACASATSRTEGGFDGEMVAPARLGVAEGQISFWRPAAEKWEPARINTALAAGDTIHAGADGTAEIQIGSRDFIRLAADARLDFVVFDAHAARFRVASGLASFDLRGATMDRTVAIDTAHVAILVNASGYYRLDTRGGATRLTVRRGGAATLTLADGASIGVATNEEVVVPDAARPLVERRAAAAADAWDRWNDARADFHAQSPSGQQLPADIYGAADLDRYGSWRGVEPYGSVWVPVVASDWVPYSAGRWQWDPFYGWTWVDDAPWGWSTSHYGRWVHLDGYWAWAPGPRVARALYAPALVAFYGAGAGVAWVPLGWDEPLVPWWGAPGFRGSLWWGGWGGPRHVRDMDRIIHRNRQVPHAVVTLPDDRFGRDHVRDARLPPPSARDLRDIRGDHPVRSVPGTIAPPKAATPPSRPAPLPPPARGSAPGAEAPSPAVPRVGVPRFEAPAGEYIRRLPQHRPDPVPPTAVPPTPVPQQALPPGGPPAERRGDDRFRRDQHRERPFEPRFGDDFGRDEGQAARGSVFRPPGPPNPGADAPGQPGGRFFPPRRRD